MGSIQKAHVGIHPPAAKTRMKKYWFVAKSYGWGWTPSSWQGWLVLAVFVVLIVLNFLRIDSASHSGSDTLINWVPQTLILVLVLVGVCYLTGEKPRFQWGNREK